MDPTRAQRSGGLSDETVLGPRHQDVVLGLGTEIYRLGSWRRALSRDLPSHRAFVGARGCARPAGHVCLSRVSSRGPVLDSCSAPSGRGSGSGECLDHLVRRQCSALGVPAVGAVLVGGGAGAAGQGGGLIVRPSMAGSGGGLAAVRQPESVTDPKRIGSSDVQRREGLRIGGESSVVARGLASASEKRELEQLQAELLWASRSAATGLRYRRVLAACSEVTDWPSSRETGEHLPLSA